MIGYYIHHEGRGHAHRAHEFAAAWTDLLGEPVTGLSSSTRPVGWTGSWVHLPRADRARFPVDPTAHERLHWAPLGDSGLRARAALLSGWIEESHPRAVVVDVSAEATILIRLHGVPVVSVLLPGRRTDAAHLTGYRLSDALVAPWPREVEDAGVAEMNPGLPQELRERVVCVGAISRFDVSLTVEDRAPGPKRAVVLQSSVGEGLREARVEALQESTPDWQWRVLAAEGDWSEDPRAVLERADVVVTTAGQGMLADVAALRKPAVVVADARPHDEQETTCRALEAGSWPVVLRRTPEEACSSAALDAALQLDGAAWKSWCDGQGARRMAEVVDAISLPRW